MSKKSWPYRSFLRQVLRILLVFVLLVLSSLPSVNPTFAAPAISADITPAAANTVVCPNLGLLPTGSSVEGLGTIHPYLNITTSTGNAITIAENVLPGAYQGPNDAPLPNYGINALNGFFDSNKIHEYEYTFAPGVTVDYFSLKMLDYGDHNGLLTSEQAVSLIGYDANGNEVARDTLAFTNPPVVNPRTSSVGDLWYTGDAATALEGQPGNYTFEVVGNDIARLVVEYDNDVSPGQPSDPHHGFALLCFEPEQELQTPPSGVQCANFAELPTGSSVEGLGTIHPYLNITTSTGNAITIAENVLPGAYQGPNDAPLPNYGINALNGFFDSNKIHEYEYTFAPGVTVDYFSLKMLDYGDHNGLLTSEQAISLIGYDANGNEVARDTLAFTHPAVVNPRTSSVGDLWYTGDAATALEGQPGNYAFEVVGSDIVRLVVEYDNNVSPGQPSDPHHGFALLCFEPEVPTPPSDVVCANFAELPTGSSVEGLGTIHPYLNITTSTGNAITIAENVLPGAYQGPNDAPVPNYGIDALNGFFDSNKMHEYEYTFAPGITVDYFSLKMLDYGDHNGLLTSEQAISLIGYDLDGNEVARDTLAFTNEPVVNPRSSSVGDLWYTGDAATALQGEPGNYTFEVSGNGIARLEIEYNNDVTPGLRSDPHHAFSLLCFEPEDDSNQELDPPTAELTMLRPKTTPEVGGKFLVEYACSETAPNLVSATINGYDVVTGQEVNLVIRDHETARIVGGTLVWLFAPEFSMNVTCADDLGNEVSTTVVPEFIYP